MNTFVNSVNNMTTTTNGMPSYKLDQSITDLFFNIGAARNNPDIVNQFMVAYGADKLLAMKTLFWCRDVRGGAGERQTFRTIMTALELIDPGVVIKNLHLFAEYGRFDDLFIFESKLIGRYAIALYAECLKRGDGLAAKWSPRKGPNAVALTKKLQMTPKQYRQLIVGLSNTVEQKMCAQDWTGIEYDHVPSVAAARYQAAFGRHDEAGYNVYKEALKSGDAKINAKAVFPHDVIRGGRNGNWDVANAQWDALPNYMDGRRILPISDVSGSMDVKASGSVTCMDVSVALGLYCSGKNTGAFRDLIITFDDQPQMVKVTGDLRNRVGECLSLPWGGSTNFEATFDLILNHAINNNVPQSDMPEVLICLSDMGFDRASHNHSGYTAVKLAKKKYEEANYNMPLLVFWNLNSGMNNGKPALNCEPGVVLVSGFSPIILKSVLSCDFNSITPEALCLTVLNSERYSCVSI